MPYGPAVRRGLAVLGNKRLIADCLVFPVIGIQILENHGNSGKC
jgi:hypothetical protein